MRSLRVFVAFLFLGSMGSVCAVAAPFQALAVSSSKPDWKDEIARRREALVTKNGTGTDTNLRAELLKMRDEDQKARGVDASSKAKGHVEIAANLAAIDASLTNELKLIVTGKGWPTISMVGIEASNAAMLILTHTHDHAWQASLLPTLENLADQRKIDASALALVIDKEMVSEGKLQRYGTQFKQMDDGTIAMYGVEDPGGLDGQRARVMLPPIDAYKGMLAQMYHLKVTNKIAMAGAQK
jgi:hypothetical protein